MPLITITQYGTWRDYTFNVTDPDKLTQLEVNRICAKMLTDKLLVNGNYYECSKPRNLRKQANNSKKNASKVIIHRKRYR